MTVELGGCCIEGIGPGGGTGEPGNCLTDYQTESDDGPFSTSNNTPTATGIVLTTPVGFVGGHYRFSMSYVIQASELDEFRVDVGLNGAPPVNSIFHKPHAELVHDDDDGESYVYARTECLVSVPAGVNTFEVYLWTANSDTQTIRDVLLEIWGV